MALNMDDRDSMLNFSYENKQKAITGLSKNSLPNSLAPRRTISTGPAWKLSVWESKYFLSLDFLKTESVDSNSGSYVATL